VPSAEALSGSTRSSKAAAPDVSNGDTCGSSALSLEALADLLLEVLRAVVGALPQRSRNVQHARTGRMQLMEAVLAQACERTRSSMVSWLNDAFCNDLQLQHFCAVDAMCIATASCSSAKAHFKLLDSVKTEHERVSARGCDTRRGCAQSHEFDAESWGVA
jgi:hypothetical protein